MFYCVTAFRPAKKGEYFISGAKPMAFKAYADMTSDFKYLIAVPTRRAKRISMWVEDTEKKEK